MSQRFETSFLAAASADESQGPRVPLSLSCRFRGSKSVAAAILLMLCSRTWGRDGTPKLPSRWICFGGEMVSFDFFCHFFVGESWCVFFFLADVFIILNFERLYTVKKPESSSAWLMKCPFFEAKKLKTWTEMECTPQKMVLEHDVSPAFGGIHLWLRGSADPAHLQDLFSRLKLRHFCLYGLTQAVRGHV